ncbi:MAG: hypothetical protein J7M39_10180 [Anaerolineae bacterium]|nr:hypothetical protein [Anaerolineae bacterium]
MDQFFSREYGGAPFELFGIPHIIALVIVALINVALLAVWLPYLPFAIKDLKARQPTQDTATLA